VIYCSQCREKAEYRLIVDESFEVVRVSDGKTINTHYSNGDKDATAYCSKHLQELGNYLPDEYDDEDEVLT
jgi:hypothetical protein